MPGGRTLLTALFTCAALAIAASPASATSVQTADGVGYVGPVTATLKPASTFQLTRDGGPFISCNESTLAGAITNSGTETTAAQGNFSSGSYTQNGTGCLTATAFPWTLSLSWIDDNVAGSPNATVDISGMTLFYIAGTPCAVAPSGELEVDLLNPDNTPSGKTELRFVDELFDVFCINDIFQVNVTGTYFLTGQGAEGPVDLQVREDAGAIADPPDCEDISATTEFETAVPISLSCTGALPITHAIDDGPDHGTISGDPSDGTLTYTPDADFSGTDTFTYTATNDGGESDPATVTVVVGDPVPTSFETAAGAPYTGPLHGTLSGIFNATTDLGSVNCNESSFTGQVTSTGAVGDPGTGTLDAIDWTQDASQACPDTVDDFTVEDVAPVSLPWGWSVKWIDDNTSGTPNALLTFTGVTIRVHFDNDTWHNSGTCTMVGNHNGTSTTSRQVQVDFYNADNTASGDAEIRFVTEFMGPTVDCRGGNISATYRLSGANGTDLQVRGEPSVVPPTCYDVAGTTPFETPVEVTLDCDGPGTLSHAIDDDPDHGTISGDPTDGGLTYTPDEDFYGTDTFTYRATNEQGESEAATATIEVEPGYPKCEDVSASTPFETAVEVTPDCSRPGITSYSIVSEPASGEASVDPSDGTFTYTPDEDFEGQDTFTYSATNAEGDSEAATVTITVGSPAPVCRPVAANTHHPNPVTVALDCTGSGPLTYGVAQPAKGTAQLGPNHGEVTFTPKLEYTDDQVFYYQAFRNGTPSNIAAVNINVIPPPPTCFDTAFSTNYFTAKAFHLNCPGSSSDPSTIVSGPAHGTVARDPALPGNQRAYIYTPDRHFSGTDTFTYKTTNEGGDSQIATATVQVGPPPAPECSPTETQTWRNHPAEIALDCTDEGTPAHAIVDGPEHGTVGGDPSDGTLTYTPDADYVGEDTLTFKATNAGGESSVATLTVNVTIPDPPVCDDVAVSTAFQQPVEVGLDCAGDDQPFDYELEAAPAHGTLDPAPSPDETVTYTPAAGFSGTDTFEYTASNEGGPSAPATVTITVHPAPVVTPPPPDGDVKGKKARCKKKPKKSAASAAKKRCKKKPKKGK